MEVKDVAFGDFASFKYGKIPNKKLLNENGKYPVFSGYRYVGRCDDYNTEPDTLVVVARGVGGTGDVKLTKEKCYLTNLSIGVTIHDSCVMPEYLYYYFSLNNLRWLDSGSAQSQITISDLAKVILPIPDMASQKKIVSMLQTIDKKIEANESINKNLLEQALLLFNVLIEGKSKNGKIGDYCAIKSGYAFKSSWWQPQGVRVIKIGSLNQDNLDLASCSYVANDKIKLASDFKVHGGDLLIAMTGATIGKFAMVPETPEMLLVNQRVGKFFLGDNPVERLPFIYCQLKQDDIYHEIVNRGQGSAQPNISAADIMSIPCVMPEKKDIKTFNASTMGMFSTIIKNQRQNNVLSDLRDTLLPRLMSGELDVSDLDL